MEALAAGTPVIAFDECGGHVEIIKTNINGVLVSDLTSEAMIGGLDQVESMLRENDKVVFDNCRHTVLKMDFNQYVNDLLTEE